MQKPGSARNRNPQQQLCWNGDGDGAVIHCIVLYLYIYIALLAIHTTQNCFQCERPREKRAVLRERKEALGSPVNKVDHVEGRSWFHSEGPMFSKARVWAIEVLARGAKRFVLLNCAYISVACHHMFWLLKLCLFDANKPTYVGHRDALVESTPFDRRVVGSDQALAATLGFGQVLNSQLPMRFSVKLLQRSAALVFYMLYRP